MALAVRAQLLLCRDDCAGLCPRCGADLNAGPCGCRRTRRTCLEDLMAVPKRRTSKSRKRLRRGHHTAAGHPHPGLPAVWLAQASAPCLRLLRVLPGQEADRGRGRLSVIRVAVDAMGGDSAPQAEIAGVLQALDSCRTTSQSSWWAAPRPSKPSSPSIPSADRDRLEIHEAADVIGMARKAARRRAQETQLQHRRRSRPAEGGTLRRVRLRRQHRRHPGRSHPAAGPPRRRGTRHRRARSFPPATEPVLVLDAGANVDCSARELVGFAVPRHRLHARPAGPAQARRRACSTSAKRTRRATRSSARPTSS